MLKLEASWPPAPSRTVWLIESHTSAAPSTDQTISTETTITIPSAIESRNDVFITDHGSMRVSRSRARRLGRGVAAALAAFLSSRVGRDGLVSLAGSTRVVGAGPATAGGAAAGRTVSAVRVDAVAWVAGLGWAAAAAPIAAAPAA